VQPVSLLTTPTILKGEVHAVTGLSKRTDAADDFREDCGYEPELKGTLGSFQVFAISFAFISVAVGVFGTYSNALQNGGPVGIWHWPVVLVGQMLVALVVAQFAARIPLSGSSGRSVQNAAIK
jgi:hypothetical protein